MDTAPRDPRDLRNADGSEYTTLRDAFQAYLKATRDARDEPDAAMVDLLESFFYGGAATMGILLAQAIARQDTGGFARLIKDVQETRRKWL